MAALKPELSTDDGQERRRPLDSPSSLIRQVDVNSVISERELTRLYWTMGDVACWLDIQGWGKYRKAFIKLRIDGTTLGGLRPLTLIKDLNVAPLEAFPLFNDICLLYRTTDFKMRNIDLDFRRKVNLKPLALSPTTKITQEMACRLLCGLRCVESVSASDPGAKLLTGKTNRWFLAYLKEPPTPKEVKILLGTSRRRGRHRGQKQGLSPTGSPLTPKKSGLEPLDLTPEAAEVKCEPPKTVSAPTTPDRPTSAEGLPTTPDREEEKEAEPTPTKRGSISSDGEGNECPICLESWDVGMERMALPCAHIFCQKCITDWLSLHRSCPICQMNPDDEDLLMTMLASQFDTGMGQPASAPTKLPAGPLAGITSRSKTEPSPGRSRTPLKIGSNPNHRRNQSTDPFDLAFEEYKMESQQGFGRPYRRASYANFSASHTPCALCHGPVKPGPRTVTYDCGHTFHKRCAKASGNRSDRNLGGCPFCIGPQAKWEFRKHSRWLAFPPEICRRLDAQSRKRGADVVVYDQRLLEIDVRSRTVRDITSPSPNGRTYRLRRQKPAPSKKDACLVM